MNFEVTKRFDGFSTAFRQWRAVDSHCSMLHGYSLEFVATFTGPLDRRNWVIDFGGFKPFRERLRQLFDHNAMAELINPKPSGVAVIMSGRHTCMCMRGIKSEGMTTTSAMLGAFRDNAAARAELLALHTS